MMNPVVPVPRQIITERLIMRRCQESDFDDFFSFLTHPTATRFLNLTPEQKTAAGAQAALWYIVQAYESDNPLFVLTVIERASGRYAGSCGLIPLPDDSGVEISYNIIPPLWGQGLATELADGLIGFIFEASRVDLVAALVMPENQASLRVAEKAGLSSRGLIDHPDYDEPVVMLVITRRAFDRQRDRRPPPR